MDVTEHAKGVEVATLTVSLCRLLDAGDFAFDVTGLKPQVVVGTNSFIVTPAKAGVQFFLRFSGFSLSRE
jgi:hypothetical protein